MGFIGQSRGPALSSVRPRVLQTGEKMGLPWDAYYVLTKAEASLSNSKVHPNSGAPNYNITHLVADFGDIDTSYLKIDGSNADQDINIGLFDFAAVDVTGTGTGTFADVTVDDGTITLADTTTSTTGVIYKDASSFIHNFQHPTGDTAVPDGRNTFVGRLAGNFTMGSTATEPKHGSYNNAMGYASLRYNTTGYYNSAMGYASLFTNTTGYNNNAMGTSSLYANTAGYQNNAMGYASLFTNTTGYNNNAMGTYSLRYTTTGYNNNAMGAYSLYANTTGQYNSAMGNYSLRFLLPTSKAITAFANYGGTVAGTVLATSVGHGQVGTPTLQISGTVNYNGAEACTVVDENTFYFTAAYDAVNTTGWWGINSEGRHNTAVGANSGYALTTGSSNVFLGYGAGYRQTTNDNLLIIDNQTRASAAVEQTNAILYGVMAATPAAQTLRVNAILYAGSSTNYTEIASDGDLTFVGGAGLSHGGISGTDETITCTNQNEWYQATFDTAGPSNNVTVSVANSDLTVLAAGTYHVGLTVCCHSAVSHDFEVMVKKNNGTVDIPCTHLYQTTGIASKIENIAGTCNEPIAHDDTVELWVRCTDAGGIDFIIDHANINVVQIGGT